MNLSVSSSKSSVLSVSSSESSVALRWLGSCVEDGADAVAGLLSDADDAGDAGNAEVTQ